MSVGRSQIHSVEFYVLGDADNEEQACGTTTSKALFSEGAPVANGLYDPHYGTTELGWDCQRCFNNKRYCPGHDGMARLHYPVQNPVAVREIVKVLRSVCHTCAALLVPRGARDKAKPDRTRGRRCTACGNESPWVAKDRTSSLELYAEWYGANKSKPDRREPLRTPRIAEILGRISNATSLALGRPVASHPSKFILTTIKIPSTVIRPEIRKIGGNRSTMSDATASLRYIMELNSQIPRELPPAVDKDMHDKLELLNTTYYEMVQGTTDSSAAAAGRVSSSIAARLPTKQGRLRGNLMGRRTRGTMRSVITGDKALHPNQLGVPRMIAQSMLVPETVREWNRARLTLHYLNGPKRYPGCTKVRRADTGYEHYVETAGTYTLRDGDVVYRHIVDGDVVQFLREPALLFCSIAALTVKVIEGFTLRMNSSICALFNEEALTTVGRV